MATALSLRKGDAFANRVSFFDKATNEPYPMTGWTLEATMNYIGCHPVELETEWTDIGNGIGRVFLNEESTLALHSDVQYELNVRAISPDDDALSAAPIAVSVRD